MSKINKTVRPPRLRPGDTVRFISPASTPTRESVERASATLKSLGLRVEYGNHMFDEHGYLAGKDEDRLADLNDAFGDPNVRAIFTTRGGKGAYRIADQINFAAVRKDPKILVGFSDITHLHLALLKECGQAGIHGAAWDAKTFGKATADSLKKALFTTDQITIKSNPAEPTARLTTSGLVTGRLIGGNQDALAISAGWSLPSLDGAILLLEAFNLRLGHIDRQLTMLYKAGYLNKIAGVAVGQYTECGPDDATQGNWTEVDVLKDRLSLLSVPILGGLPIGHGQHPVAVPIGTRATMNAGTGELFIDSAVV